MSLGRIEACKDPTAETEINQRTPSERIAQRFAL